MRITKRKQPVGGRYLPPPAYDIRVDGRPAATIQRGYEGWFWYSPERNTLTDARDTERVFATAQAALENFKQWYVAKARKA